MKSLKIFSDLKFEKDGETILINANGDELVIELSDQKILNSLKKISFGGNSIYNFSLFIHKRAKIAGVKIILKTPEKTILTLGDTSFYSLKKMIIQIAKLFNK